MNEHKILISGPVGAGKTTAVRALSSKQAVSTDVNATEFNSVRKNKTTVAMDYGVFHAGGERMHLYGTPGQERFQFMWEILGKNACGLILLIDNSRDNPLQDMKHYLKLFHPFSNDHKVAIGVTCMDLAPPSAPTIKDYKDQLLRQCFSFPVCAVDARKGDDVLNVVFELIDSIKAQSFDKEAMCF